MNSPRHSVSVAATVVDERGRMLVIQRRDNGRWEPPGGVLELDESILDGVRREVLEETGLVIEPIRLTGVYKNMARGIVAMMFLARVVGGELSASEETTQAEWWTPEAVGDRMDAVYAVRILDALRPDGPAVRTHDGHTVMPEDGQDRPAASAAVAAVTPAARA
ncbi:NUDIX hydrolase [Actinoplanes sp. CA-131856]